MSSGERDVLTSLPRSRSTRRSPKRRGAVADAPAANDAPSRAVARPAAAAAGAAPAPKLGAKAAPSRARAAKPKAARTRAAKPSAPAGQAEAATTPPREAPPAAGWATPPAGPSRPGGGELLGTAVQAVVELAQIGLTFGGQALKQALSRLPRP